MTVTIIWHLKKYHIITNIVIIIIFYYYYSHLYYYYILFIIHLPVLSVKHLSELCPNIKICHVTMELRLHKTHWIWFSSVLTYGWTLMQTLLSRGRWLHGMYIASLSLITLHNSSVHNLKASWSVHNTSPMVHFRLPWGRRRADRCKCTSFRKAVPNWLVCVRVEKAQMKHFHNNGCQREALLT